MSTKVLTLGNVSEKGEMSMAVRPFFCDTTIEGRKSPLKGGPSKRDGKMTVEITQRNKGEIETAFTISSFSRYIEETGVMQLVSQVKDHNGDVVEEYISEY